MKPTGQGAGSGSGSEAGSRQQHGGSAQGFSSKDFSRRKH